MKHLIVIIGLTFFIGCAFNQPLKLNHSKTVGKSIHEAASDGDTESVKKHLALGTDINLKDELGWTPLHWASSKVHNKTSKFLIKMGAEVNIVNKDGLSPLDYAENEMFGILIDHGAKSGIELRSSK